MWQNMYSPFSPKWLEILFSSRIMQALWYILTWQYKTVKVTWEQMNNYKKWVGDMVHSLSACLSSVKTRAQVPRTYSGERPGFLGFQDKAVETLQVRQKEITYTELKVHEQHGDCGKCCWYGWWEGWAVEEWNHHGNWMMKTLWKAILMLELWAPWGPHIEGKHLFQSRWCCHANNYI